MFPDGAREGLYHTADATLWFFHAVDRYVTRDRRLRHACGICCRPSSTSSGVTLQGTRFGIGVDPADGLLRQGAEGYQLTWMDAKVDDWVVTPRRGKAVEINALWYNALRLLRAMDAGDRSAAGGRRARSRARAERACARSTSASGMRQAATSTTWSTASTATIPPAGRIRCFAISLDNPVLDRARWAAVMQTSCTTGC